MSGLAGGYVANFLSYRKPHWNPDFGCERWQADIDKYKLTPGIGAVQHFCQDLTIGFHLGWKGLLEKIEKYRQVNTDEEAADLYDGLRDIVLGMQNWIGRNAANGARDGGEGGAAGGSEKSPRDRGDERIPGPGAPRTFREAVQWMHWYQMAAKMFNSSGSLGRIDQILWPYYNGKEQPQRTQRTQRKHFKRRRNSKKRQTATALTTENTETTIQTTKKRQERRTRRTATAKTRTCRPRLIRGR